MAYISRFIPCAPYEIKTFETWLETLAQEEGLFLVSCRRAVAKFEKGTPKPMRYRVDADPDRSWDPTKERCQFFEEFGWEYIDNRGEHLVVYGTDDFSLPELHTEPELQMSAFRKLQIPVIVNLLLLIACLIFLLMFQFTSYHWIYWAQHPLPVLCLLALSIFCFLSSAKEFWQIQRVKKQLLEEPSVPAPTNLQKAKRHYATHIIFRAATPILLSVAILSPFFSDITEKEIPLTAENAALLPIPSAADLGIQTQDTVSGYYIAAASFLTPAQYEIHANIGDTRLDIHYISFCSESLAEKVTNKIPLRNSEADSTEERAETLADGTHLHYERHALLQILTLQKGTCILILQNWEDASLWESREKFYPLLDKVYPLLEEK